MKACWLRRFCPALLLVLGTIVLPLAAVAQDAEETVEKGTGPATATTTYIPLAPAFVVNYGGTGRLKYLKAEISVRVDDRHSANSVRHHMPLIRNNLVMLFSRQSEEDVRTQEGKERLRQTALAEINRLITEEDGKSGVVDLFFNNLIIQQ